MVVWDNPTVHYLFWGLLCDGLCFCACSCWAVRFALRRLATEDERTHRRAFREQRTAIAACARACDHSGLDNGRSSEHLLGPAQRTSSQPRLQTLPYPRRSRGFRIGLKHGRGKFHIASKSATVAIAPLRLAIARRAIRYVCQLRHRHP